MPPTPPGMTWPSLVTLPLTVPEPPRRPPLMVTVLVVEVRVPPVRLVLPPDCV